MPTDNKGQQFRVVAVLLSGGEPHVIGRHDSGELRRYACPLPLVEAFHRRLEDVGEDRALKEILLELAGAEERVIIVPTTSHMGIVRGNN